MEEIFEEQSSEKPDVQRYLEVVRRRHIHFLIPLFLGWFIVWEEAGFYRCAISRVR